MSWSRSWVSRHLSLHLSIRGDEVRVRSCLIFRYRIWPKKQCILEKHSNLLQKYNSCRLLLTITHKYLSSHETRKHRHIFARVAAFLTARFSNLTKFGCSLRRGGISYTLDIFHCECKRPPYATHKISSLYLKSKHHILPPQKKSHYFWTGVYMFYATHVWYTPDRQGRVWNEIGYRCQYQSWNLHL